MERISDIACKVNNCGWYFEPSWKCDVNTYTKRGNRYVGVMSRQEKSWGESFEDFYKKSYMVYFLHKDITPRELKFKYKCMFDDSYINIMAFNKETIIAEKFETLINEAIENAEVEIITVE